MTKILHVSWMHQVQCTDENVIEIDPFPSLSPINRRRIYIPVCSAFPDKQITQGIIAKREKRGTEFHAHSTHKPLGTSRVVFDPIMYRIKQSYKVVLCR
jgi:hypothetical protein